MPDDEDDDVSRFDTVVRSSRLASAGDDGVTATAAAIVSGCIEIVDMRCCSSIVDAIGGRPAGRGGGRCDDDDDDERRASLTSGDLAAGTASYCSCCDAATSGFFGTLGDVAFLVSVGDIVGDIVGETVGEVDVVGAIVLVEVVVEVVVVVVAADAYGFGTAACALLLLLVLTGEVLSVALFDVVVVVVVVVGCDALLLLLLYGFGTDA